MSPVRPQVILIARLIGEEDQRLRDFLTRAAQPFDWLDAESPEALRMLEERGIAAGDLPALLDGDDAIAPATVERVAEAWGVSAAPTRHSYDLAIIGAGPAGLAAAVYAASDGLSTVVLEEDLPGGQASYTSMIENFFGFPDGIGGAELARRAGRQAERFGAELAIRHGVTGGTVNADGTFALEISGKIPVEVPLLIASPGMVWRRVGVESVEELLGRGVYYGAGRSEAAGCDGRDVVVVGGGNSAGQAALHLANSGARVKLLVRNDRLGRSMSAYLAERIEAHPLIDIRLQTEVESAESADGRLAAVTVRGPQGTERLPAELMFLCIGGVPRTAWAGEVGVRTDPRGFILTGPDLLRDDGERAADWTLDRDPLALETSVPGLFAAGDVRHGSAKRVGGAVGEGAMAVALAERRLEEIAGLS